MVSGYTDSVYMENESVVLDLKRKRVADDLIGKNTEMAVKQNYHQDIDSKNLPMAGPRFQARLIL